jgi:hypothetical protein
MADGWFEGARTIACVTGSIAPVTCAQLAEGEDAQVLGPALSALGMRPSWQAWDEPIHAVRNAPILPETTVHDVTPEASTGLFVPERITSHRPDPDAAARIAAAVSRRL